MIFNSKELTARLKEPEVVRKSSLFHYRSCGRETLYFSRYQCQVGNNFIATKQYLAAKLAAFEFQLEHSRYAETMPPWRGIVTFLFSLSSSVSLPFSLPPLSFPLVTASVPPCYVTASGKCSSILTATRLTAGKDK